MRLEWHFFSYNCAIIYILYWNYLKLLTNCILNFIYANYHYLPDRIHIKIDYRIKLSGNQFRSLIYIQKELKMTDNGGAQSGNDRRKFQYTAYIPERRSGRDRRKGFDRRSPIARRKGSERRANLNHHERYSTERRDVFKSPN